MFHGSQSIVVIAVVVAARFGLARGVKAVRRPRRRARRPTTRQPPDQGARGPAGLVLHQARYDLRTLTRNAQARTATIMLPLLLLVLFLGMWGSDRVGPDGAAASTSYVPGLVALSVIASSFVNLVISVVTQRETGVLKRRRATPVPDVGPDRRAGAHRVGRLALRWRRRSWRSGGSASGCRSRPRPSRP